MTRTNRKGFTLIEILIVVIILGILAAIVIPQFTNASKEAKQSSLVTQVQSMRSQIALFKLQHNDYLPGQATLVGSGGTFAPRSEERRVGKEWRYGGAGGHGSGEEQ